jgi:hypothetical protein
MLDMLHSLLNFPFFYLILAAEVNAHDLSKVS